MNTAATRRRIHSQAGFPSKSKPAAFGCCEPSPTTQCSTGLFGVCIGREVGINFNMTSAMSGPLGHISPTLACASWHTKTGDMLYWKRCYTDIFKKWLLEVFNHIFITFQVTRHYSLHQAIGRQTIKHSVYSYTTSYIFFIPLWLTRNFPWCSKLSRAAMRTYLTLPRLAGNPRVPWLDRLRPPHRTGWVHVPCDPLLSHHDDHRDALLTWLVMHCHRQPEWFPVYRFPYKLGGHCLKQTLLILKGELDADNGGYWKQNISSHMVMYLKMLL